MIITRSPLRISLFGGGTDFPKYYNKHTGRVICFAINQYNYINIRYLRNYFDHSIRLRYFKNEQINRINSIKHPVIKNCLYKYFKKKIGIEIIHNSDIPARTGLGSSSSFTNSLILSLHCLLKRRITQKELFHETINMEQEILKESVGSQDQIITSLGGFKYIQFYKDKILYEDLSKKRIDFLKSKFILVFLGFGRDAKKIEKNKIDNMKTNKLFLNDINSICMEAYKIIKSNKSNDKIFNEYAYMMKDQWNLKKKLSKKVTNAMIDDLYNYSIKNGAFSGKILGAGGGGFMLFLCKNKKMKLKLKNALRKFNIIDFDIDYEGSKIIYEKS